RAAHHRRHRAARIQRRDRRRQPRLARHLQRRRRDRAAARPLISSPMRSPRRLTMRFTLIWIICTLIILCILFAAGCGGNSSTPPDAGSTSLSVSIGPIPVAAGGETTVCTTVRLSNATDVDVVAMSTTLAPGSHHLILYRSTATTESPSLTPC